MKKILTGLILIMSFQSLLVGQTEMDVKSEISKVTVYPRGVQIESAAAFELKQGRFILSFKNLSPFINSESIRVDGNGKYTILNVQLHNDYLNELERTNEIVKLNADIQEYLNKIEDEETWIKIQNEKLEFLKLNRVIAGKDQSINPEVYRSLNLLYGENIEKYSLDVLKRQRLIKEYTKVVEKLRNQLNSLNSRSELPSGIISLTVDSKQAQSLAVKLTYFVESANWYPTYDIRFVSATKPLTISYKANIIQNTGVNWKNVDLKLSTAKTNISAQIPTLSANYLQYNNKVYSLQGRASGVSLSNSTAMPAAAPSEAMKSSMDTPLEENSSIPITSTSKNETSNEYTVEAKQTLNTDGKLNTILFRETELNASYEYQSIPKLSKNVYLIGKITDWYKADLSDGVANIYLENSYVGESTINTHQFSDTLDISFGIDNNISVNREKIKDYSESQFIGSAKKETFAWKLTIRNNKSYSIKAKLFDQVPVSSVKDIQVDVIELSGGTMNPNTGKVVWSVELNPNETKQVILKYSVKYPKDQVVLVD